MEGHWTEAFESDSITDENRAEFNTANAKYATEKDAIIGGYNAQKMAGKPFRVPEDMATLPDDQSRADFRSQANKALGHEFASDIAGLADLDLKVGSAEGTQTDEALANEFKQFVVDKNVPKALAQEMLGFYNGAMGKAVAANKVSTEAAELDRMTKCNDALIAMPDIGTKEKLAEMSELFRRAFANNFGLSADEQVEVADAMVAGGLTQNPKLAKIMLDTFAPLAKEGSSDGGDGSGGGGAAKQLSPYETKKARWANSPTEWGDPNDSWDDESQATKKVLGYKAV